MKKGKLATYLCGFTQIEVQSLLAFWDIENLSWGDRERRIKGLRIRKRIDCLPYPRFQLSFLQGFTLFQKRDRYIAC